MGLFNKGALLKMKEQEQEVLAAPVEPRFLEDTTMAPAHTEPVLSPGTLASTRSRPSVASIEALEPILSQRPKLSAPAPIQGKEVFADQDQLDQAIYTNYIAETPLTFGQKFHDARKAGKTKFTYNGSRFNTMEGKESESEWLEALKDNKSPLLTDFVAGFERERDTADIPPAKEVGNQLFKTRHPINEQGENVRLMTVGGGPDEPVRVIPSMVEGVQLSEEDAIAASQGGGPQFGSIDEAEAWNRANHGKISSEGRLLSEDQEGGFLKVKNTRTAPTFKMLEAMEAPTETKLLPGPEYLDVVNKRMPETAPLLPEDKQAPSRDVTVMLNEMRADTNTNMAVLELNSGYRTPEKSAELMMGHVAETNSGDVEKDWVTMQESQYDHHNYPKLIKAYFANRTPENLQAIGDERIIRENSGLLTTGHGTSDSADYSVRDLTSRAQALKRVAWFESQGLEATLEYWAGAKKEPRAHIHVNGINALYAKLKPVN